MRRSPALQLTGLAILITALTLPGTAGADPGSVSLQNSQFVPGNITVRVGEAVVWTHRDGSMPHTVTADNRSFDSHPTCSAVTGVGCMQEDDTYRYVFNQPGQFPYYCKVHGAPGGQGMAGTVMVQS